MGETDYGALFGVELDADGATAEPGGDTTTEATPGAQGGKEQGLAEPVAENENEDGVSGAEADADGEGGQSPEDNARFAAARRKAETERDAAIEKAKADAKAEAARVIDEIIAGMGLINPYTRQPVRTRAEYDAYQQQKQIMQKAEMLKKAGMSEEEFKQFVEGLPEVKAARKEKADAEATSRQARQEQAKAHIDAQIADIAKFDPSIKSINDLKKMPNYDRFYALVKKGNDLVDAYKLANMEQITAGSITATKQAALNAANSKNHLEKTTTRGAGTVSVPRDIAEAYRAFNPDATEAEIQAHYNNYMKK